MLAPDRRGSGYWRIRVARNIRASWLGFKLVERGGGAQNIGYGAGVRMFACPGAPIAAGPGGCGRGMGRGVELAGGRAQNLCLRDWGTHVIGRPPGLEPQVPLQQRRLQPQEFLR